MYVLESRPRDIPLTTRDSVTSDFYHEKNKPRKHIFPGVSVRTGKTVIARERETSPQRPRRRRRTSTAASAASSDASPPAHRTSV